MKAATFLLGGSALLALAACNPNYDLTAPKFKVPPKADIIRDTSATISWETNERANSVIEYGSDTTYGTRAVDDLYLTRHSITVSNLQPQTTYHMRAESYDVYGNGPAKSQDLTITTTSLQPPPNVVVNEVMYNPTSATTGEFIELYNAGASDVDLTGFTFTDGDSTDSLQPFQGGGSLVPAGGFAVIVDPDYTTGLYAIPAATTLMTTLDTTIGNGLATDDTVALFAPGIADAISTYGTPTDTADAVPITTAPTGKSVERGDPTAPDAAGNWCISMAASGSTPGAPNAGC